MTANWYYAKGKEKVGPVSFLQLQQLAKSGNIKPHDMIFQEGEQKWVSAFSMSDLFDFQSAQSNSLNDAEGKPTPNRSNFRWWGGPPILMLIAFAVFRSGCLSTNNKAKTSPNRSQMKWSINRFRNVNPAMDNPTLSYWSKVNSVCASTRFDAPRSIRHEIHALRSGALKIQNISTLNVDPRVVTWALNVAQVYEQLANLAEVSKHPLILVEAAMRGYNNDPFGVSLELIASERQVAHNYQLVRQEGIRLRAALTTQYGTEFPHPHF